MTGWVIRMVSVAWVLNLDGANVPAPIISERGADYKIWSRIRQEITPTGRVVERRSSYKELATGMHVWRGGQWIDAKPVFEVFPDGIVARQCRHQVVLARTDRIARPCQAPARASR